MQSDEDLDQILKSYDNTWHLSCTARMGQQLTRAVVDAGGRVYGLSGLRIVDASVMPIVTNGNTNTTIMMAEKLAMKS